jgi:hypothetical protein
MKDENLAVYLTGQFSHTEGRDLADYLMVEHTSKKYECNSKCLAYGFSTGGCPGTCTNPEVYYVRVKE